MREGERRVLREIERRRPKPRACARRFFTSPAHVRPTIFSTDLALQATRASVPIAQSPTFSKEFCIQGITSSGTRICNTQKSPSTDLTRSPHLDLGLTTRVRSLGSHPNAASGGGVSFKDRNPSVTESFALLLKV